MKHRVLTPAFFLAGLVTMRVLANGGGYELGVKFTGALAPFQASGTQHVQILNEALHVDLRRTEASVVVRYTMRNRSEQPVKVKFGFPVEAQRNGDKEEEYDETGAPPSEAAKRAKLTRAMQQLKSYSVRLNGAALPATFVTEPFASGRIPAFPGSEVLSGVAGWMVSEAVFPTGDTSSLEIRYVADHEREVTYVSDDYHWSALVFRYRLSTGAVWSGAIASGTVTIRADGIPSSEVEIAKPDHRFEKQGDEWVWKFKELEPTLADDITIKAVPGWDSSWQSYGDPSSPMYSSYIERLGKWGHGHQHFKVAASSSLRSKAGRVYGPNDLARFPDRFRPNVPWCEGASSFGLGEYVELAPLDPKSILAIGLFTAFHDSNSYDKYDAKLFTKNARPSRVEIELNGEHRFSATLGDSVDEQLIPIVDYTKPVSKVRIIIKDVYPGSRYQDTCLSSVIVYDVLAEKPDARRAR